VVTQPTGGLATGVWGSGNYIYVADYPYGLLAFDITDPTSPELVDTFLSSGEAFNVTGSGNHLFLSDGLAGVHILSITNPADPVLVSTVEMQGYVNDVAVSDTLMYAAVDSTGVIAYSIGEPSMPYEIATYYSPGNAKGVFARGRNVFLGDNDSFIILLLSDATGIDDGGTPEAPSAFSIDRIYPNPFNPEATIEFSLSQKVFVSLDVYDQLGRHLERIMNGSLDAGSYNVRWNGDERPSGVYFFRLSGDGVSQTEKATILK
jgi:hypothetical protein